MWSIFIQHQWKAFWRSKNIGKSVAVKIILGLFILYIFANLFLASLFLDRILLKVFPGQDVIRSFTGCMLYYFLMDLLMRFQLQELPTLSARPYLHLPVGRKKIVNYLSFVSLKSAFNLAPFILALPFLIQVVLPQKGAAAFVGILIALIGLTLSNHFFNLWLKRKINLNAWFMLAFLAVILGIGFLDFRLHLISVFNLSALLFAAVVSVPWYSVFFLLLAGICFKINHKFLRGNLYLDELASTSTGLKSSTEIPFLDRFGAVGYLAANELKLIFRNKRPKSTITMTFLFIFYGLLFYKDTAFGTGYGTVVFCGMFITGIFIINYGQFMFSWQSSHFDGILVHKVDIHQFFKAKFLLFTLFSTVLFLLSVPYVYFGWHILLIHFVMYLWNLGVNTLIILYFANRNYKRIDLSKGASFNWEGVGATQWLLSIPLLFAPFIVYLPFMLAGQPVAGIVMIAIVGIAFIVTREFWMKKLVTSFKQQRYKISEEFRNE